jgi:hypothetical protein
MFRYFCGSFWSGFAHRPQVALAGALTRKWSCKKGNKGMTALIKRKSNEPGKQAQAAAITP